MNIDAETLKKIEGNGELLEKLEELWNDDAPAATLAQAISDAGINLEISQVEELLAQKQAKLASAIALDEVDDEQLKKVAGGVVIDGEEYDFSCDSSYFCHQNVVEQCVENLTVPCSAFFALGL